MTAKYFAILTNQGAARLANAAALGTRLNLTQMAVGDANGVLPTPDPAQTKLINQKRIAPLNLLTVDPDNTSQIIAEQIIPENEGGFWIREIGLYDDAGVLIAVANCPETYKPQLQEGSGRTQTIRMILIVSNSSAITLKIDPSVVLATRQYVDDRVIEVKSYADGLMRAHEQSRNHPDATTTAKGFTQLNSSVTDDRETQAATPKAVKIAMDNANARLAKERNLADLPNPALARQNLQLGDSSTKNTGTTANTVAAGDDARITGSMQKSQNGADIQDVAKFLKNLGISDEITRAASAIIHSGDSVTDLNNAPKNSSSFAYGSAANSPGFNATILTVNSLNDSFDMQIAIGYNPLKVAFRSKNGDTSAWQSWLVLGAAASRDVGTAANQLPDMSKFEFQNELGGGMVRFPQNWMLQWKKVTIDAASGTKGATTSGNFLIPFTSVVIGCWANVESRIINVAASPFVCASNNDLTSFLATNTYTSSALEVMVYAIGR